MADTNDLTYVGQVHGTGDGSGSLIVEGAPGRINFLGPPGGPPQGLQINSVDYTAVLLALATKAGAMATGVVVLDGSNPTTVVTGLNTVVGAILTAQGTAAPGLDPVNFTWNPNGTAGSLDIYAWKATSNSNPTLIASTNNAISVAWIAFGT